VSSDSSAANRCRKPAAGVCRDAVAFGQDSRSPRTTSRRRCAARHRRAAPVRAAGEVAQRFQHALRLVLLINVMPITTNTKPAASAHRLHRQQQVDRARHSSSRNIARAAPPARWRGCCAARWQAVRSAFRTQPHLRLDLRQATRVSLIGRCWLM